jgi:hypothetical protein
MANGRAPERGVDLLLQRASISLGCSLEAPGYIGIQVSHQNVWHVASSRTVRVQLKAYLARSG